MNNNIFSQMKDVFLQNLKITNGQRDICLTKLANEILKNENKIISANLIDINEAEKNKLTPSLIDRLKLNPERIKKIVESIYSVQKLDDVFMTVDSQFTRPDGLMVKRQRYPLGVIGLIFESRPNVLIEAISLAIKSGNVLILKGGKEAAHTIRVFGEVVQNALQDFFIPQSFWVLDPLDRKMVDQMLKAKGMIDCIIPRGGEGLINYVYEHSRIPIIAHYKGVVHCFLDESMDMKEALPMILNAKASRPGVCNALECLLVHESHRAKLPLLVSALKQAGVTIHFSEELYRQFSTDGILAAEDDMGKEFLSLDLLMVEVKDLDQAITYIQKYTSNHTECILTHNIDHKLKFFSSIDASCLVHNASTRFNDGFELGLGSELGISTSKLHVYGPMGLKEMTTLRFVLEGNGQIRN